MSDSDCGMWALVRKKPKGKSTKPRDQCGAVVFGNAITVLVGPCWSERICSRLGTNYNSIRLALESGRYPRLKAQSLGSRCIAMLLLPAVLARIPRRYAFREDRLAATRKIPGNGHSILPTRCETTKKCCHGKALPVLRGQRIR